jgi:hypothetical protein
VGELLQDPKDTSAALRSALYQAAALIPGTEALGTIADHAGQQGQGIGLTKNGVRSELIVDPSSGPLLGTEDVALDPSAASDAARSFLGGALWTLGSLRQFPPRQHHRMGRTVRAIAAPF